LNGAEAEECLTDKRKALADIDEATEWVDANIKNDAPMSELEKVVTKTFEHEQQYWDVTNKYHQLAEDHAKLLEAFALRQRNVEQLLSEKERLERHNEQCKAVIAAIIDVHDVVLPYKVLQKGRALLGRGR